MQTLRLRWSEWAMDEFRYMASGLIPEDCAPAIVLALHAYVDYVAQRKK